MPHAGGFLDQDSFHVYGMKFVIEEQQAKEAEEQHKRELEANRRR
jgi:hypothetical protein